MRGRVQGLGCMCQPNKSGLCHESLQDLEQLAGGLARMTSGDFS